jgi:hypothetical protein
MPTIRMVVSTKSLLRVADGYADRLSEAWGG